MLREYQQNLINATFQSFNDGFNAPCIVLPCGGGKSVIVAEIAKIYTEKFKKVLFLVHRKELCEQITDTFNSWGVNMLYCQIAMVQTIARRLKATEYPDLIITDENHHSLAETYKKIYTYFSNAKRIGVTATPERINGQGLADVNDKLIVGVTPKWLIENKYLSPYDYYAPDIKIPKFHIKHGDFDIAEVSKWFTENQKKIYGDVIKNYNKIAFGKQCICYLPSIEISRFTAKNFSDNGITSAHIDGETPKNERENIIRDFRNGKIKILCNVDIISEGFDVPDCEGVILLRPTKSLILYTQQAMRCMRYKPNKTAIIIDHVNNVSHFGFPDAEREWTLEGHPKKKREATEQAVKVCPKCFRTFPLNTRICQNCGFMFEREKREAEHINMDLKLISGANLESKVKHYLTPSDCQTVEELKIYAKQHGYKSGWVYYQQKSRGWLNGKKEIRNTNTKRYPCRAIPNWDSPQK